MSPHEDKYNEKVNCHLALAFENFNSFKQCLQTLLHRQNNQKYTSDSVEQKYNFYSFFCEFLNIKRQK